LVSLGSLLSSENCPGTYGDYRLTGTRLEIAAGNEILGTLMTRYGMKIPLKRDMLLVKKLDQKQLITRKPAACPSDPAVRIVIGAR